MRFLRRLLTIDDLYLCGALALAGSSVLVAYGMGWAEGKALMWIGVAIAGILGAADGWSLADRN